MRPLAAGALVLLLAACQGSPPEQTVPSPSPTPAVRASPEPTPPPEPRTTLRYAIGEPDSLLPFDAVEADSLLVVDALFDSLTAHGPDLEPVPAAAVRWRAEEAHTRWTFILRRGATFHDGTPVTAEDFVFSWNLAAAEGAAGHHLAAVEGYDEVRAGQAETLRGLEADGEHVLRVRLRHPYADFAAVAAHPALGPVPASSWEADQIAFAERPIGNGPFAMAEDRARGRFIRLQRADGWDGGEQPRVAEILFQVLDGDSAYLAFQQGRLDVTTLPAGALEDALERYGSSVDGYSGPGVLTGDVPILYYLGFNVTRPPYNDDEVRRAVSLAIDSERIAAETLDGNVEAAAAAVPPAVPGARARTCAACRHDPDAARQIFAERDIEQLALWFNRHGGHESVARLIREDLAAVGVRAVFRTDEFAAYLETLEQGDAGLFRFGWSLDYPTHDEALYPLFHSASVPPGDVAYNYGRFHSPEVDTLLDQARRSSDVEERRDLFTQAERSVLDEQAIVPLMTYRHRVVVSDRLIGFRLNPLGAANFAEVRVRPTDAGS